MDELAVRMVSARELEGITQEEAAASMHISVETLEKWETGIEQPRLSDISRIAGYYHVTTDWLLTGMLPSAKVLQVTENLSNRMFDENKMYTYVGAYANAKNYYQTKKAMAFAREMHQGQFRKERGGEPVPYIYHPLIITCHALALGFEDDDLLAAAMLHDVCEDCGVDPEQLPVSDEAKEAVRLLTKPSWYNKTPQEQEAYYNGIASNRIATIIKLLDRCHNISGMANCFGEDKMASYIMETEEYLSPIMENARNLYPEYSNQFFLIKYHMTSVIDTLRHYMKANYKHDSYYFS